jgi:arsenite-transporting ATPase
VRAPAAILFARRGTAKRVISRRAAAPSSIWHETLAPDGVKLLLFGGKGGVGKTTCAAAAALALAERTPARRILLLSTDPAHSLADVLLVPLDDAERPVPAAGGGLHARELDADRAFGLRRERYQVAVDALFNALLRGSRLDMAYDRAVAQRLIDLAPPGLDELFAILAVVEALDPTRPAPHDLVIVDTAPTGHALRLLAMPATALEWVHALLEILLKYRRVIGLGDLASDLLAMARDLRALSGLLADARRARFVAVTRAAELPRLETTRLLRRLDALGVAAPAVIVNAMTAGACRRCARAAGREARVVEALGHAARAGRRSACAMIFAPAQAPPPRGVAALLAWGQRWQTRAEA